MPSEHTSVYHQSQFRCRHYHHTLCAAYPTLHVHNPLHSISANSVTLRVQSTHYHTPCAVRSIFHVPSVVSSVAPSVAHSVCSRVGVLIYLRSVTEVSTHWRHLHRWQTPITACTTFCVQSVPHSVCSTILCIPCAYYRIPCAISTILSLSSIISCAGSTTTHRVQSVPHPVCS